MSRPRKMTTEQMIEVVDSYYLTCADGSASLLKCSLIAAYAAELGFVADGYDFRRNTQVREYIDRLKEGDNVPVESVPLVYKNLDVSGFLRVNAGNAKLTEALSELDAYWRKVSENAALTAIKNQSLMKSKAGYESALKDEALARERLNIDIAELSGQNNKLVAENRYLRKMLRTYLYPAVANEILLRENVLKEAETQATDAAVMDMTEFSAPQSLRESAASDMELLSEDERLLARMWELCDE